VVDAPADLAGCLGAIVPGGRLETVGVPRAGGLRLQLLAADYPQGELGPEDVLRIMDNPLYWAFCWSAGQVLARYLLRHRELVRGRRVLDFGCGSGVVAIAASMAGAAEVIACDNDPLALEATRQNARLNAAPLTLAQDFAAVTGPLDLILAADVLYDRSNFRWPARFLERSDTALVADSRLRRFDFEGYREIGRDASHTLPDLDESAEFREVRLYRGELTSEISA
jgi:predicted nicotinamide N-methyase